MIELKKNQNEPIETQKFIYSPFSEIIKGNKINNSFLTWYFQIHYLLRPVASDTNVA
jgi:hypothetical protein